MTISSIKLWFFGIFMLSLSGVIAQDELTVFWQPQVGVNYKVADDYSHNFILANRNFLYRDSDFELDVRQVDITHFSKLKIRDNQSVSLGLMWRNSRIFDEDRVNEFRLTQQYNITFSPTKFRFGHRVRTEQRIFDGFTLHRFRYRFAVDFPLEGEKLDVGESYSVLSAEPIITVANDQEPLYNFRLRAGLGMRLSPKSNLQFVLQYRLINYSRQTSHVLLLETALNLGI